MRGEDPGPHAGALPAALGNASGDQAVDLILEEASLRELRRGQAALSVDVALTCKRLALVTMNVERSEEQIQCVLDERGIPWPPALVVCTELPSTSTFKVCGLDEPRAPD